MFNNPLLFYHNVHIIENERLFYSFTNSLKLRGKYIKNLILMLKLLRSSKNI